MKNNKHTGRGGKRGEAAVRALALCAALAAAGGCSRSSPDIAFSTIALNYIEEETGQVVPALAFFVLADDADGYEDLAELRLYNDFEGLQWSWTPETWVRHDEAGNTWIGSRRILMAGGEAFPSGQYRAVLIDKSGERMERSFGFDVPETPRYPFPSLAVADGRYTIESEYPDAYFLCYGTDGSFRSTVLADSKSGAVSQLGIGSDILSVALWAHDREHSVSALTKMLPVR